MRIVVDSRGLLFPHKTGIQDFTENLLLALVGQGQDEYLLALDREPADEIHPVLLDNADLLVVRAPAEPRPVLWEQHYLPRAATQAGADLLYAPAQILPCSGRFATVATIHDGSVFRRRECFTAADGRYFRRWIRASAYRADRVSTVSEASRSEILALFRLPEGRVRVVYPAVDHAVFHPGIDREHVRAACASLGIQRPYVLYLGALEPRKNVARLVEAFARLVRARADLPHTLVLAGARAWLFEAIEEAVRRADLGGRIHLVGYVPAEAKPALYAGADLFAYPSLYEGFGTPPVEAMACGTPTLVGDRPAMPEIAGGAAILVDPESVESIASGLERGLDDQGLREELKRRGLERARSFDWQRTGRGMRELFAEAAA